MTKNLIIVESPSKAKTIKKMLGKNYEVIASAGHIRDLPKSRMAIDVENNYKPEYINIRGKGSLINEIKAKAKASEKVYLATDPDREGEAISWHLAYILGLDEDSNIRIEFNEITNNAIKAAVKSPRKINIDYVNAQQGRRVMDRLVGYKISPFLWAKVKSGLSAGRVQSVVVKLICDREKQINDFVPEKYYNLYAKFVYSNSEFIADYFGIKSDLQKEKVRFESMEDAEKIKKIVDGKAFVVDSIEEKENMLASKPPYITSTLQQDASRKLGFSISKTMQVAQKLYEGMNVGEYGFVGLITYMRTDSTRISTEALSEAKKYIVENFDKSYYSDFRIYKTGKSSQDAHECIRPTLIGIEPIKIKSFLSNDEYKLYNLIWTRFIASQMSNAVNKTTKTDFNCSEHIFRTVSETLVFDGYLKLYPEERKQRENTTQPLLKIGEMYMPEEVNVASKETQPPARYNEASLIKTLEKLGIGRPSTYAPTISTIVTRNYVKLVKKVFYPTEIGILVNNLLETNFSNLVNEKFTAEFESQLDLVEEGKVDWTDIVDKYYKVLEDDIAHANISVDKIKIEAKVSDVVCEKCGRQMVIKEGKFGEFLACPGYPECKNTKPINKTIGVVCPKCNKGEIIELRSKTGRIFYGCSNYPDCDFSSLNKPAGCNCPNCGKPLFFKQVRKKDYNFCEDKNCGYSQEV